MASQEQIFVIHLLCCFPCSWISFSCLYFNNNCSVSIFILFSAKDWFLFMINSISCIKFSSTFWSQSKLKQKVLGSLITVIFSSTIVMTWLNCCRLFWWFYYADTNDTVFVWFRYLISLNYFQLLFVLIILEVYLIICLESKLLIIFLLLLPHLLLVVACQINVQILLYHFFLKLYQPIFHFQTRYYNYILQETN